MNTQKTHAAHLIDTSRARQNIVIFQATEKGGSKKREAIKNRKAAQKRLAALAAAAFVHKNADAIADAHLAGLQLIYSRFDAVRSVYSLAYTDGDVDNRFESDHLTDLSGSSLQVVADYLEHGAAMPSGFEIVSRTKISPPGPVFRFLENGVAHKSRNPAAEQVVVRVMGVKYGFRRGVV